MFWQRSSALRREASTKLRVAAGHRRPRIPVCRCHWPRGNRPNTHLQPGRYCLRIFRTGYRLNDAYSAYIDMKLSNRLSAAQIVQLRALTLDLAEPGRMAIVSHNGSFDFDVPLRTNDVVFAQFERVQH